MYMYIPIHVHVHVIDLSCAYLMDLIKGIIHKLLV